MLTDPPYGVGKAEWDARFPSARTWKLIRSGLNDGGSLIVFSGEADLPFKMDLLCALFDYQWVLVWYKPNAMQFGKTGFSKHNLIWWLSRGPAAIKPNTLDVIVSPMRVEANNFGHPSPKPTDVIERLVNNFCPVDATVLDPFMGSGTALRAAKDLGRKAIGIEIEERYCEIAAKRLSQGVLDFSHPMKSESRLPA